MSELRWAERDTTPERIEGALRELVRERHAADEALVPARVLNLVVIADREWRGEVLNRLERLGEYHGSRTILCTVEERRSELDAWATIGGERALDARVGVLRETVEIALGPAHLERIDTIIDPVIVSELPTVLWSPHSHDEAVQELLTIIDVILIDTDDPLNFDGPGAALARATELRASRVHVVDLAWLRTTPWRERLAGCFESSARRSALSSLAGLEVRCNPDSVVAAALLAGWLASRLQWRAAALEAAPGGAQRGTAAGHQGGSVAVTLVPVAQAARGIAGVTVSGEDGFSLTLERAPGGLAASERAPGEGGVERRWRMFGSSRGEAGILGDGVRQALLRDPTYGPALQAARSFMP